MRIKRFEAVDMAEALKAIKKEFGPDAVILSARSLSPENRFLGLFKKPGIEVTAAIDDQPVSPAGKDFRGRESRPEAENGGVGKECVYNRFGNLGEVGGDSPFPSPAVPERSIRRWFLLYRQMLDQGVDPNLAMKAVRLARDEVPERAPMEGDPVRGLLVKALARMGAGACRIKMEKGCRTTVALIGTAGVGKTTTTAKLAAIAHRLKQGKRVALIATDEYRIAAIAQLRTYAEIIGVPFTVAPDKERLQKCLDRFSAYDLVLVDTAGISPRNPRQARETRNLLEKIDGIEVHLLLSAATKEKDLSEIVASFREIPIHRLLFTKLDESTTYGNILNLLIRTKNPVSYFTTGQDVPEGIEAATLEKLIRMIVTEVSGLQLGSGHPEELAERLQTFEKELKERSEPVRIGRVRRIIKPGESFSRKAQLI